MKRRNILFDTIGILGGEPFLHSDLRDFCSGIKERYRCRVLVTTNGFWLRNWEKHKDTIKLLDELVFSIYQPIQDSMSRESMQQKIEQISSFSPNINIRIRDSISHFSEIKFTSAPETPTTYCDWQADCTNLLPDGRLARCGVGAYAKANPSVSQEFLNAHEDMFYDLSNDDGRDFGKMEEKISLGRLQILQHVEKEHGSVARFKKKRRIFLRGRPRSEV